MRRLIPVMRRRCLAFFMCLGKLAYRALAVQSHVDIRAAPAVQDWLEAELLRYVKVIDAYFRCALLELVYGHGTSRHTKSTPNLFRSECHNETEAYSNTKRLGSLFLVFWRVCCCELDIIDIATREHKR